MNTGKIVKVRFIKGYKEATSHICIGEIKAETANYLSIKGRTFHFDSNLPQACNLESGYPKTRWLPWHRIEVVTEMSADMDWEKGEFELDASGDLRIRRKGV